MRTCLTGSTDHAQAIILMEGSLELLAIVHHESHWSVHVGLEQPWWLWSAIEVSQQLAIQAHGLRMLFLSSVLGELLAGKMVLSHGLERRSMVNLTSEPC
jgi:hypothetical protein